MSCHGEGERNRKLQDESGDKGTEDAVFKPSPCIGIYTYQGALKEVYLDPGPVKAITSVARIEPRRLNMKPSMTAVPAYGNTVG